MEYKALFYLVNFRKKERDIYFSLHYFINL